ncbi:hypothetical protein C5167_023007 [Papaver somniferum]|uniref:Uncharacterized protein n=1 Tax=Papaver somniferum TaxID=3469 RepID=A0A4Y7JMJ1_PAPSO|nr:hypothetical protein C5167_023007 [Papaver somniferum]
MEKGYDANTINEASSEAEAECCTSDWRVRGGYTTEKVGPFQYYLHYGNNSFRPNTIKTSSLLSGIVLFGLDHTYHWHNQIQWRALNDINVGVCEGMTYKEINKNMHWEYEVGVAWKDQSQRKKHLAEEG